LSRVLVCLCEGGIRLSASRALGPTECESTDVCDLVHNATSNL
jgi:hypothetical protein